MQADYRWIVVRMIEDNPPTLHPFEDEDDARRFYKRASWQWTGALLCRIALDASRIGGDEVPSREEVTEQARLEERRRVGMELQALGAELLNQPGAGLLPFALSDIGSRLEAGQPVEGWQDGRVIDAEHEEVNDG